MGTPPVTSNISAPPRLRVKTIRAPTSPPMIESHNLVGPNGEIEATRVQSDDEIDKPP